MTEERLNAKSLKLAYDEIVCPSCYFILAVPDDMVNDQFVQCVNCDAAIENPFCKIINCGYCLTSFALSEDNGNDLMVDCDGCGEAIYNIYSDKYTPVICPNCKFQSHLIEEGRQADYLSCPDCLEEFRNPLRYR